MRTRALFFGILLCCQPVRADTLLSLPDGSTVGRTSRGGIAAIERVSPGGLIWRVALRSDAAAPRIRVDGETISVEAEDFILHDFVRTRSLLTGTEAHDAPLRMFWSRRQLPLGYQLSGFERLQSLGAIRTVTVWKDDEWFYVGISNPKSVDAPAVLMRLQHQSLMGKRQPTPQLNVRGMSVSVVAGWPEVFDDGVFTICRAVSAADLSLFRESMERQAAQVIGSPAPELVVSEWRNTAQPLRLERLRGRVTLLDFWGNWCTPCVAAIPGVVALANRKGSEGLQVIGVHSREAADRLDAFLKRRPFSIPLAIDGGADTQKLYAVYMWPTYVVIDKKGTIRYRGSELPSETLLTQLLAE